MKKANVLASKSVPFEKSRKDKEPLFTKEGSVKEEAMDKKQAAFKCGGAVKKMATGGQVCRGGGAAVRGKGFSRNG